MRYIWAAALITLTLGLFVAEKYVIAQSTKQDLIIESLTLLPRQPSAGQTAKITIIGRFEGPTAKTSTKGLFGNSILKTFIDFNFDSAYPAVQPSVSAQDPLEPGEKFMYEYTGSFQLGGTKELKFDVDYEEEIDEASESNNTKKEIFTVFSPALLSDLKLTGISASPTNPTAGDTVTLVVNGIYSGPYSLESLQGIGSLNLTPNDFMESGSTIKPVPEPTANAPLASGAAFTYSITGTFASGGSKTLDAVVDSSNELWEKDETNNSVSLNLSVADKTVPPETSLPPVEPPPTEPTDSGTTTIDWDHEGFTGEAGAVIERIKRLDLPITEYERTVVMSERGLTSHIDDALTSRLAGEILLQVESVGEAWYVDPLTRRRYYLKDGVSAYNALQAFGLGITVADLELIPVGIIDRAEEADADDDGLSDAMESALGSDADKKDSDGDGSPDGDELRNLTRVTGSGRTVVDDALVSRLSGRILLQVESRGEAWFVHKGRRYFLGNGDSAYQIMRFLSLGVTNSNLRTLTVGSLE